MPRREWAANASSMALFFFLRVHMARVSVHEAIVRVCRALMSVYRTLMDVYRAFMCVYRALCHVESGLRMPRLFFSF